MTMFYDEALREILPRLRSIADPQSRIDATQKAFAQFRKDFPNTCGCTKFFAQIEVEALDELAGEPEQEYEWGTPFCSNQSC